MLSSQVQQAEEQFRCMVRPAKEMGVASVSGRPTLQVTGRIRRYGIQSPGPDDHQTCNSLD
jgi:hypothetical protein